MNQRDVHEKVEERNLPVDRDRAHQPRRAAIECRQQDQRRTERHEEKEQRRRVFGRIEKRDRGPQRRVLRAPRRRIAISVNGAQNEEGGHHADSATE
jgi:hypothetical protein